MTDRMKYALSGAAAGAVNGLFGGGGGMVLAPVPCPARCRYGAGPAALRHLRGGHPAGVRRCPRRHHLVRRQSPWTGCRPCPTWWAALGAAFVGGQDLFRKVSQLCGCGGIFACLRAVRRREVSPVTAWLLPLAVGFATGILSAWGVGGGTLLLLCMTLLLGVDQRTAQTINLLYFLPTAGMGLLSHGKSGLLEKPRAAAARRPRPD